MIVTLELQSYLKTQVSFFRNESSVIQTTVSRATAVLHTSSSSEVFNRLDRNERLRAAGQPYNTNNRSVRRPTNSAGSKDENEGSGIIMVSENDFEAMVRSKKDHFP